MEDKVLNKPVLRIGLIGTGFMGRTHVLGYSSAHRLFDLDFDIDLHTVADITESAASEAASQFGFTHCTSNWIDVVSNPDIDVVSITTPNSLHKDMALAAIANGKHVYCEKPLATTLTDAHEMVQAAQAKGLKTQVGFNYLCNPMIKLARDMIAAGELGELRSYRGIHAEDYMANSDAPFSFRFETPGGGALADLGSHALATAEFLCGPVENLMPYDKFSVAPGHQLGFNDLKAIEVAGFCDAIANKADEPFNFQAGLRIQSLVDAVHNSSRASQWMKVAA